jgi:hypothetical protein
MKAAAVAPGYARIVVIMNEDPGGMTSAGLIAQSGTIVSTTSAYDGVRDLAVIDVPLLDLADFTAMLDENENVVKYAEQG